jgi:hypothetical protein
MRDKCKFCTIEVVGYASDQGRDTPNAKLAKDRATYIANLLRDKVGKKLGYTQTELETKIKALTEKSTEVQSTSTVVIDYVYNGQNKKVTAKISNNGCRVCPKLEDKAPGGISKEERKIACPVDTQGCKLDRYATVRFKYNADEALAAVAQPDDCIQTVNQEITESVKQKFYNETMFFDKLKKTDSFIFEKFKEKIQYFHPAFHSTTPEGFNSRLTFLHQCTRQGPTMEEQGANNLAFGRPPVCILRIGDFYNTKIIIDSLSIDYEPLVWDLNPEGIGVQPMIANVSLSFKFIGAESLYGPINKLQNALSFNYYANSQVYEGRADYIAKRPPEPPKPPSTFDPNQPYMPVSQKDIDKAGPVIITALRPYYLVNGLDTVNPEVTTTFTKELSKTNTCDTNQVISNDKNLSNEPPASGATTTGTTSATTQTISLNVSFVGNTTGCKEPVASFLGDNTVNINITNGGLDKDYQAILKVYDKNQKPREITSIKIEKNKENIYSKNAIDLKEPDFVFDKSGVDYKYQVELDIVGYKKFYTNVTLKFFPKC